MGLTQGALAEAMGVQRKHVNELCNNRRNVTAPTALILARVFGNSPDFWLNVQRRSDLWERCIRRANASGSTSAPADHRRMSFAADCKVRGRRPGQPGAERAHLGLDRRAPNSGRWPPPRACDRLRPAFAVLC